MQTTQAARSNWLPGFLLIIAGAAIGTIASFFKTLPVEIAGIAQILALVLIAWGITTVLWQFQTTIFKLSGPLCIFAGALILFISLILHSLIGVCAGGFIAILGGVLLLRKK